MVRRLGYAISVVWGQRKADVPPVFAILACTLILFQDAIRRGWIYYEFDTSIYYYPVTRWLDKAISQGVFPLWSPYIYGGFPLFADGESGALYPPTVALLTLLSPAQAFIAGATLHYFLAGVFAYAFLRVLRQDRLPSLITGLTFAFGSFMVSQMHHVNIIQSSTWLPLILLSVELAFQLSGWRRLVYTTLGAAALAMQLLTMHVQPVLMTFLLVAAWIAFRVFCYGRQGLARRVGLGLKIGLGTAVLGLGLAAVQILPMAELITQAARGNDQGYVFGSTFAPALPNLLTLLFPYFFRIHGYDYWTLWFRWETTLYVGIAPLAFAVIAVIQRRSREVIFFAVFAIIAGLLMMGDYSPINLYWLWWHLPGMSGLRAPGRFSLLVVFSLAVLAGMGAQFLQSRLAEPQRPRAVARAVFALALASIVLFASTNLAGLWLATNKAAALDLITNSYLALRRQPGVSLSANQIYDSLRSTLDWHNGRTDLSILLLFATAATVAGWLLLRRTRLLWQTMLVGLVAADLLAFAVIYHPQTHTSSIEAVSPTANFLAASNGLHRVYTQQAFGPTTPNLLLPQEVASVSGYSSLEGQRYREYQRLLRQGNMALLDLWNVRYIVALKGGQPPSPAEKYRVVFENGDTQVYENSGYLPRAFVVGKAIRAESPSAALELVSQPQFDPRTAVVIETGRPSVGMVNEKPGDARPAPAGRAQVTYYDGTQVRVEAEIDQDGYLVLGDVFYPGWEALVDGRPADLYRANYLFRAVALGAGRHTVVFRYDPLTIKLGGIISASTALLAIALVAVGYLGSRRRQLTTAEVVLEGVPVGRVAVEAGAKQ